MNRRHLLFWATFAYLILLILSIVYYKERVIFADVAYILFKLMLEGDWAIQVNRFVSFFTQSFGLAASQLGLSIKWVAIIHSAGFIIFYYSIFLILWKVFRNTSLALGLLLYNTLMVTMSFYWTPSELIQGGGILFLYLATAEKIFEKKSKSPLLHLLSFALLLTTIFAHPLLIVAVSYSLFYQAIHYRKNYKFIGVQLGLMAIIHSCKSYFLPNAHDTYAMSGLKNIIRFFSDFDLSRFGNFFHYLIGDYILMTLGALLISLYFIRSGQILKLFLFCGFFVGYSILVNIGQVAIKAQFYLESQLLILSIFVILPYVKEILPLLNSKFSQDLLACVIILCLLRIQSAHSPFTERIDWYRNLLDTTKEYPEPKLWIDKKDIPQDLLLEHWGASYECALLSTIETGESRSIFISKNQKEVDRYFSRKLKNKLITKWNLYNYKDLNKAGFNFKDTSTIYIKYKDESLKPKWASGK